MQISLAASHDAVLVISKERYEADLAKARLDGAMDYGPQAEYLAELEACIKRLLETPVTQENRITHYQNGLWDLSAIRDSYRKR